MKESKGQFTSLLGKNDVSYKSLFEHNPEPIFSLDLQGDVTSANPAWEKVTGYKAPEVLQMSFMTLVMTECQDEVEESLLKVLHGTLNKFELTLVHKEGHRLDCSISFAPIIMDNQTLGVYGIVHDISQRKSIELLLQKYEQRYSRLVNISSEMILVHSQDKIVSINPAGVQLLGAKSSDELVGKSIWDIIHPDYWMIVKQRIQRLQTKENLNEYIEQKFIRLDGNIIDVTVQAILIEYLGETAVMILVKDITERNRSEEMIHYLAYHDSLTGLPNRMIFNHQLTLSIDNAQKSRSKLALMFMNLDRFKIINNSLGHDSGDLLLRIVEKRLKGCLIEENPIFHLGGDEFTILLPETSEAKICNKAQEILNSIAVHPFLLEKQEIFITASIGISVYPSDGNDRDTLIKNANMAVNLAKNQGGNHYRFFTPVMNSNAIKRITFENNLRRALSQEEFVLHYQPKVELHSGKIIGMEALIRWNNPDLGIVSPSQFIPLAEETGLIVPIGEWVIRNACTQNKALYDAGFHIRVAVNLSARQFQNYNLVETVKSILQETGLEAQLLEFEITESLLLQDTESTILQLNELKELGIHISIDDFGTGYSSLSYLKQFPIDSLKIDQSFVRDIIEDKNDAEIVTAIISLGHSLNLKVIAEGVETEDQLIALRKRGCDDVQGYLFSRPLVIQEFESLL